MSEVVSADGRARVKVRRVNSKMRRISVRMIDLFKGEESFFFVSFGFVFRL